METTTVSPDSRMAGLPLDPAGHPIFWCFLRENAVAIALNEKRCFFCGEKLGSYFAFVIGSISTILRTYPQPPAHRLCALYAALAAEGTLLRRTSSISAVWLTQGYKPEALPDGRTRIQLGDPTEVLWFKQGREATEAEITEELETAYALLLDTAKAEGDRAVEALTISYAMARNLAPQGKTTCQIADLQVQ